MLVTLGIVMAKNKLDIFRMLDILRTKSLEEELDIHSRMNDETDVDVLEAGEFSRVKDITHPTVNMAVTDNMGAKLAN